MLSDLESIPEFKLFCEALRPRFENRKHVASASNECEWTKVVLAAQRHRVESQLVARLADFGRPPPAILQSLRDEARHAARTSLMQVRETARLATSFRRAKIRVIALKGVALSVQLERDATQRHSRDIDLLVSEDSLLDADLVLRRAGYEMQGPEIADAGPIYHRWNKEIKYFHPQNQTLVELHYRLVDNAALLNYKFDELWTEHDTVAVGDAEVAVMPRRRLALFLCAHGATHAWERLCWLIDLATALRTEQMVDEAVGSAEAEGLLAPMLQAILLCHRWLGMAVGEPHLTRAKDCRRVAWLNFFLARSYGPSTWFLEPPRRSLTGFMRHSIWLRCYVYGLKAGWRYQKVQMARELIAPADWQVFRLPPSLQWAYPLLRPIGWIVRRLTGIA